MDPSTPLSHRFARPALLLLPGERLVAFLVLLDGGGLATLCSPAGRFPEALRAACDLLGFSGLQREDAPLDELLPWAGNV